MYRQDEQKAETLKHIYEKEKLQRAIVAKESYRQMETTLCQTFRPGLSGNARPNVHSMVAVCCEGTRRYN